MIEPLIAGPVREPGEVKLEFHHFPMSERPTRARRLRRGGRGRCRTTQWQFIELFFRNQDEAEERGGHPGVPGSDRQRRSSTSTSSSGSATSTSDEVKEVLDDDDLLAAEPGFPAEPAVVVSGPGGTRELIESPPLEEIDAAIDPGRLTSP